MTMTDEYLCPRDTRDIIGQMREIQNTSLKMQKYIKRSSGKFKSEAVVFSKKEKEILEEIHKIQSSLKAYFPYKSGVTGISQGRLVIGLGGASVFETSISLHHSYSMPYVPASALKGAVRNYIIREAFEAKEAVAMNDNVFIEFFGCEASESSKRNASRGQLVFLDAFPQNCTQLELDVMTPHFREYYEGNEEPADTLMPEPVVFCTLPAGLEFEFYILSKSEDIFEKEINGQGIHDWFKEMLEESGIGAKTAVGYGYFQTDA